MGKLYILNASSKNASGQLEEVVAYKSSADEEFRFRFTDGVLMSWDMVHLNTIPTRESTGKN